MCMLRVLSFDSTIKAALFTLLNNHLDEKIEMGQNAVNAASESRDTDSKSSAGEGHDAP